MGKKWDYDPELHPLLVKYMARDGKTVEEIAKELGLSATTFKRKCNKHEELKAALKEGKALPDYRVKDSLYRMAIGFEYEERKTIQEIRYEQDGKEVRRPLRVEIIKKRALPNVTAIIFWLKNRLRGEFRDTHQFDVNNKLIEELYRIQSEIKDQEKQMEAILGNTELAEQFWSIIDAMGEVAGAESVENKG